MFSVLMSIYEKENPDYLKMALDSVLQQTLLPSEIVIVKDGALTDELEKVLDEYLSKNTDLFNIINIKKNVGLGKALNLGVEACKYDIVARMDADDIARIDRFEKQFNFLSINKQVDVVGSYITEFDKGPENIYAIRKPPSLHSKIVKFAKFRNPLNHMTVMFRKQSVLDVGNYPLDTKIQDYHLWVKMIINGAQFANIPECLVNVRAGQSMIQKRSGFLYLKVELELQKEFLKLGFINYWEFSRNIFLKTLLRLMPTHIKKFIYNNFLRKKLSNNIFG